MKTSEVLNRAADLIEERGWIGTDGKGWEAQDGTPLCIEGAIQAALGMPSGVATTIVNTCPAGRAVRDYLDLGEFSWCGTEPSARALFSWNDEIRFVDGERVAQRTAEQVIATLRAAAVIEAAKETAGVPELVR